MKIQIDNNRNLFETSPRNNLNKNVEVALSQRRTIGELYHALIADIKAEMESTTQKCTKYEAFEVHVKMICSFKKGS